MSRATSGIRQYVPIRRRCAGDRLDPMDEEAAGTSLLRRRKTHTGNDRIKPGRFLNRLAQIREVVTPPSNGATVNRQRQL